MRINRGLVWLIVALMMTAWPQTLFGSADDRAEVRAAVQRIFNQMKSRQYDELYDSLSNSTKQRFTRQRFASGMQRADDNYRLERIEIGGVRLRGNTAVVDTVIYGRVLRPTEGEGKIVAQQTLVREDGQWRVTTSSPGAGLSGRAARIYLKRDGRWVDVTAALRSAAGGRRRG